MLKIKCDINQQDLKRVDLHFVKSEYSLEVVDRVRNLRLEFKYGISWNQFPYCNYPALNISVALKDLRAMSSLFGKNVFVFCWYLSYYYYH